jgi:hypothetical protein
MKITREEIVDQNNLLGQIVLNSFINLNKKVQDEVVRSGEAEILLTLNGEELDIASFINEWQSQIDRIVNDTAVEILNEKIGDLNNTIYEFSEMLQTKIKEEYEK